ncbi:MAG: hypothetical protein A3F83_06430 [Candidatus Glassbacteria bacterium RIFCSPLOWO2_12_FULL_58_11]|uniref:Uncharacterized protein n=2 Tax=Candidatus Glassiibacteriota TaxID=1817805 RepID=A0A1F5YL66_9BACT|nr:MAG: hypothetical protein A2Z86_03260 [Candidatus Glassbacteria bacterium GWA2_58_10]OGG00948.1 MAG: hypothetical protein A3F83_06430 [Candidatus Glassbacteria bacterium RIFCSPLOWO2_12_FULL_58_11]
MLNRFTKLCRHKNLDFLGKQLVPGEESFLALFNCRDCHSTISLAMRQPLSRRAGKQEPALRK